MWPGAPAIELCTADSLWIDGDPARLGRVIQNIVGNAVKYSPLSTTVTVSIHAEDPWAVVVVSDHGVGIPPDELPRLFTHFFRASTAVGIPGTGIGLAGSRQILEQHGGRIGIESALGHGTTARIWLPFCADLQPCQPVAQPDDDDRQMAGVNQATALHLQQSSTRMGAVPPLD
jgi:signal transduction histidine kinase